ncbi:MAG: PglZ domain-containing protein [Candidatus Xenobiia bacterium LiM19]
MGKVKEYLISLLEKQVDQNHVVIWFDPEKHYEEMASNLSLPGVRIFRYTDSFFSLRHEVDPLMSADEPPSCIIYVPMSEEKTEDALVCYTVFSSVLKPGQNPWQKNTRLSVIARSALKQDMDEKALCKLEKQVEQGQLSFEELDNLKEMTSGAPDVVSVIFKSGNLHDMILGFLDSDARDDEILSKNAVPDLCRIIDRNLGISLPSGKSLPELREIVARTVLITAFITELKEDIPAALSGVKLPAQAKHRAECIAIARKWRMRSDLRNSFINWAQRIDRELLLHTISFSFEQIASCEVFPSFEKRLQSLVEEKMLHSVDEKTISLAATHESSFWSQADGEVVARWNIIIVAGRLLNELNRIADEIKGSKLSARDLINRYTSDDNPWCIIDSLYRNLGFRYLHYDGIVECESLGMLVQAASSRYMDVGGALSEIFVKSLQRDKFDVGDLVPQREVYDRFISPGLSSEKTAYILVDALRYEMGLELRRMLSGPFNAEIFPVFASIPTVTEIGMASLMPDTKGSAIIVTEKGRLALRTDKSILKDRASRLAYLKKRCAASFVDMTLDEILYVKKSKKKIMEKVDSASLVIVTTTEIDTLCETGKVSLAQSSMDMILIELRNLITVLTSMGVKRIVITADHGYLMGEELESDMKIEPPGGDTLFLHRRAWAGKGGASSPAYMRCRASDLGFEGDLEIAVPYGFGAFKAAGGDLEYFHGGISLQEAITPLITVTPREQQESSITADIVWSLKPGSKKVTTRFFSVQVHGLPETFFEFVPPVVRMEMRAGADILSDTVSSTYGFVKDTGDIELRVITGEKGREIEHNTIMLQIVRETSEKQVSVHLVDALSGRELARLEKIEWAITQ